MWYILTDPLLHRLLFIMYNSPKVFKFFTALLAYQESSLLLPLQTFIVYWLMLPHCNDYSVVFLVVAFFFSALWLQNWKTKIWNAKESTVSSGICSWDKTAFLTFSFGIPYWCTAAKTPPWHRRSQKGLLCLCDRVLLNVSNSKSNGTLMWKCL